MGWGKQGCLRGCTIGCGAAALLIGLALAAVVVRTCRPLREASGVRAVLEERFGPAQSYVPAADGTVEAARLREYIAIRRSLSGGCRRLADLEAKMRRVDRLDEREPTGREVGATSQGFVEVLREIAPAIGEYFEQRNAALLRYGMGLGEYTHLFVTAHNQQLVEAASGDELFLEDGVMSAETRDALREMLRHQLRSAERGGGSPGVTDEIARELGELERDPLRLPWEDGLPARTAASLAPFREELDAVYCPTTAGIETDGDARRALAIALY